MVGETRESQAAPRWLGFTWVFFLGLTAIFAVQAVTSIPESQRTPQIIAALLLRVLLFGFIGCGGLVGGIIHIGWERRVATSIGWPSGNPFRYEVGGTNLAIGTLGFLSRWVQGDFAAAGAISAAIFSFGAGIIHLFDVVKRQNQAPWGGGVVLYVDLIVPIALLGLLAIARL